MITKRPLSKKRWKRMHKATLPRYKQARKNYLRRRAERKKGSSKSTKSNKKQTRQAPSRNNSKLIPKEIPPKLSDQPSIKERLKKK
jgi:hypothetical protein